MLRELRILAVELGGGIHPRLQKRPVAGVTNTKPFQVDLGSASRAHAINESNLPA